MLSCIGNYGSCSGYLQQQAMGRSDPADLFDRVDSDGSGGISLTELEEWVGTMSDGTGGTLEMSDTFSDYDLYEDGVLSSSELDSLLTANGTDASATSSAGDENEKNTVVSAVDSESVISEYDTNEDGVLSSDELQAYLDDTETATPRGTMRKAISSYAMNFENIREFDFQDVFMNSGAAGTYNPINIPA